MFTAFAALLKEIRVVEHSSRCLGVFRMSWTGEEVLDSALLGPIKRFLLLEGMCPPPLTLHR